MAVTVSKPAFNLREVLANLRQKLGAKGTELLRANTTEEVYSAIGYNKNLVINGDFQVWQRGTSFNYNFNTDWTADRWWVYCPGATSGTLEQSTDVPPGQTFTHSFYFNINAACSAGTNIELTKPGNNSQFKVGSTWTLSFWIKSPTYVTNPLILPRFRDSHANGNNSVNAVVAFPTFTCPTNTWTKIVKTFTITGTAAATNKTLELEFSNIPAGTKITGLQFEKGAVVTPFEHRLAATELVLCQRYFQVIGGQVSYQRFGMGYLYSSTGGYFTVPYKVTMRAAPSLSYNGSFRISNGSGSNPTVTSLSVDQSGTDIMSILVAYSAASGYGAGLISSLEASNDSQAKLFFNSEL